MLVGIHTTDYAVAKTNAPDLKVGRVFFGANKTTDTADKFVGQLKGVCDPLIQKGYSPYPSFKFPVADIIAGKCDVQIIAGLKYLQTLTAVKPVWTTSHHEPENDMTAANFVAQFDHVYALKELYAPDVKLGVVSMGYQWRSTAGNGMKDAKTWMSVKKTDFFHNDVYSTAAEEPLSSYTKWTNWLNAVQQYTLCKTVGLAERGYNAAGDQVGVMKADQAYLKTLSALGLNVDMYLYWDSMDSNGVDSYKLTTAGWAQLAAFAAAEAAPPPPPPPPPQNPYPVHTVPLKVFAATDGAQYVTVTSCDVCFAVLGNIRDAQAHYSALHR